MPPATIPGTSAPGFNEAAWDLANNQGDQRIPAADLGGTGAIAGTPQAIWLGQDFDAGVDGGVTNLVNAYQGDATGEGKVPLFVIYSIPYRDCGSGFSGGGSSSVSSYMSFVQQVKAGVDGRRAIIDVEPDASVDLMNGTGGNTNLCDSRPGFNSVDQNSSTSGGDDPLNHTGSPVTYGVEREEMIGYAVSTLGAKVNGTRDTTVYLDAGNYYSGGSQSMTIAKIAPVLEAERGHAGQGFAVDTSATGQTATEQSYGDALSARLLADGQTNVRGQSPHYIVDTSRNGNGDGNNAADAYCNLPGLALGARPTTATGDRSGLNDALLWLKGPGYSDGQCTGDGSTGTDHNAPDSGVFWACYAEGLYNGDSPMPYPVNQPQSLPAFQSAYPCDG